jgi:hypothetical protein
MFSVHSVPIYYKQDSWNNELVVRQPTACKNVSTEAEAIVARRYEEMIGEDT